MPRSSSSSWQQRLLLAVFLHSLPTQATALLLWQRQSVRRYGDLLFGSGGHGDSGSGCPAMKSNTQLFFSLRHGNRESGDLRLGSLIFSGSGPYITTDLRKSENNSSDLSLLCCYDLQLGSFSDLENRETSYHLLGSIAYAVKKKKNIRFNNLTQTYVVRLYPRNTIGGWVIHYMYK